MAQWFITFPQRLSWRDCYRLIDAPTREEAHRLAHQHHASSWCFVYPIDELDDQIERYGLTELKPPIGESRQ